MTEVTEYQEHLNSHSEKAGFIGLIGLRPIERLNQTWISTKMLKKEKKCLRCWKCWYWWKENMNHMNITLNHTIQSYNPVIWIYRPLNLWRQDASSYYFVVFWITQGSPSKVTPYFLSKKYISILETLETVC